MRNAKVAEIVVRMNYVVWIIHPRSVELMDWWWIDVHFVRPEAINPTKMMMGDQEMTINDWMGNDDHASTLHGGWYVAFYAADGTGGAGPDLTIALDQTYSICGSTRRFNDH